MLGRAPALEDVDEFLRRWSALHSGAAVDGLVGWWLRRVHRLARYPARVDVRPDLITVLALVVAWSAVPAAAGGTGAWLVAAAAAVAAGGVLDALDGAVAVLTARVSRWGFVLDSGCDRLAEAGFVTALWCAGAPGWLAVVAGAVGWWQEYLRARAGAAGMREIGVVTVAERPTRVLVTAMFLLAAGAFAAIGGPRPAVWAATGAGLLAVLGLIGSGQLAVAIHRHLRVGSAPGK